MNKKSNTAPSSELYQELEDLVGLAEESSKTIDQLVAALDKARLSIFFFLLLLYCTGIGAFFFFMKVGTPFFEFGENGSWWLFGSGFSLLVLSVGSISLFYSSYLRFKKSRRDLKVEQDIHNRLVSLISEQVGRLIISEELSPIAQATLEIRIRRLDRTDKKAF